jgi:hypothetical protein
MTAPCQAYAMLCIMLISLQKINCILEKVISKEFLSGG